MSVTRVPCQIAVGATDLSSPEQERVVEQLGIAQPVSGELCAARLPQPSASASRTEGLGKASDALRHPAAPQLGATGVTCSSR